jgi:hypothetical protein
MKYLGELNGLKYRLLVDRLVVLEFNYLTHCNFNIEPGIRVLFRTNQGPDEELTLIHDSPRYFSAKQISSPSRIGIGTEAANSSAVFSRMPDVGSGSVTGIME